MKYSMTAARLFPIQDTRTPTQGPKTAPFKMTMGSVGIGVAERMPMRRTENRGPAIPVLGICCSMFFRSLAKRMMSKTGTAKVMKAMRRLRKFFSGIFFINNLLYRNDYVQ